MTTENKTQALAARQHVTMERRQEPQEMSFDQMMSMGDHLVRTGFLPQHIKTGAQAAAIIMKGRELGMAPMRALGSLKMVKGNVVEDAASQLARFKSGGGRASFTSLSPTCATLHLRHPNGDEHTETWDEARARAAGLWGQEGPWRRDPCAMLRSRAITAGLKSLGWEGGVGVYAPGELPEDEPAATVLEALPRRRAAVARVRDAAVEAAVVEHGVEDGAPDRLAAAVAAPAPRRPTNRDVVRVVLATMQAIDDAALSAEEDGIAQQVVVDRLTMIERHWVDERDGFPAHVIAGVSAYLAQAQAHALGIEYVPTAEEAAAIGAIAAYRRKAGSTSRPPEQA